jgi:hypothetical protein
VGLITCLLAASPAAPAFPEEEGGAEAAQGTSWVDGWAAGTAKAKQRDKLIFLYFGRHTPT